MNVYIFSFPINIFKSLLKTRHNIECFAFFNFSVTQVSQSVRPSDLEVRPSEAKVCELFSGHASKQESHVMVQTQH